MRQGTCEIEKDSRSLESSQPVISAGARTQERIHRNNAVVV